MGVSVEVVLLGFVLVHGRQAGEADGWVMHHRVTGGKETGVQICLWMDLLDVGNVLGCLTLEGWEGVGFYDDYRGSMGD